MGFPLLRRGQLTNVAALMTGAAAPSADNTFDFVKDFRAESGNSAGNSLACAVSFDNGATSLKVAFVKNEGNNTGTPVTCTSLTGSTSGAWTALTSRSHSNNDMSGRWFYLIGGAGTDATLTAAFSTTAANFKIIQVSEWLMNTTAIFDVEVVNSGTGTAVSSGNITPSAVGLVLAGYAAYNNNAVTALLIGNRSGVNIPEVDTTFTQCWGSQQTAVGTVACAATVNASSSWICNAIAFKGTGARPITAVNYAHQYWNFTAQAAATQLSAANIASSQQGQGNVAGQVAITATGTGAADLTVLAGLFTLTNTVIVAGAGNLPAAAHKGWGLAHTVGNAPTYWKKTLNRHRNIINAGFMKLGAGVGVGVMDFWRITTTLTGRFMAMQVALDTFNFRIETNPAGVTTRSTGFTIAQNDQIKWCAGCDFQASFSTWKAWTSTGTLLVSENPSLATEHEDIAAMDYGNVETGISAGTTSTFEHLMHNFDLPVLAANMFQP